MIQWVLRYLNTELHRVSNPHPGCNRHHQDCFPFLVMNLKLLVGLSHDLWVVNHHGDRKSGDVGPLPNGLFMAYKWGLVVTILTTLPEPNSSHLKIGLFRPKREIHRLQPSIFRVQTCCCFREFYLGWSPPSKPGPLPALHPGCIGVDPNVKASWWCAPVAVLPPWSGFWANKTGWRGWLVTTGDVVRRYLVNHGWFFTPFRSRARKSRK